MENKKIILIIEDEIPLRDALGYKLKKEGFNVLEAKNGNDGLKLSVVEHPDLIILDLLMPRMDGMTMLRKLREDKWGKTVPVIILTNLPSADEKRNKDITELEPTYYFMKVDKHIEEIVEKIKERLGLLG
jgi:DNA-binding response OmpR family regulator